MPRSELAGRLAALRSYARDPQRKRATAARCMHRRYWTAVRLGLCVQSGCKATAAPERRKCHAHVDADRERYKGRRH